MTHLFKNIIFLIVGVLLIFIVYQSMNIEEGILDENKRKVIKIGAVLPITGSMAKYGKSSQQALELALQEINKDSKKIELIVEDSALEPKKALFATRKLIDIDKVQGIVGPIASSETLAVVDVVEKNKVLLMSPGSSAPSISKSGEYIFRTVPSDTLEGSYIAKYIFNKLNKKTIAIYYIQNGFGEGIKNVFMKTFKELGGVISTVENFTLNQSNHRTGLLKINSTKPNGIYIIGYNEMVSIFEQAHQLNIKTDFFSTTMLNDQDMVSKISKEATEGTVFASWDFSINSTDQYTKDFIEKFSKSYGYEPDVFSANSYDALKILALALEKKSPINYIYNIKGYNGASGTISFDNNGDVFKPMVIKMIHDGKITNVK